MSNGGTEKHHVSARSDKSVKEKKEEQWDKRRRQIKKCIRKERACEKVMSVNAICQIQ